MILVRQWQCARARAHARTHAHAHTHTRTHTHTHTLTLTLTIAQRSDSFLQTDITHYNVYSKTHRNRERLHAALNSSVNEGYYQNVWNSVWLYTCTWTLPTVVLHANSEQIQPLYTPKSVPLSEESARKLSELLQLWMCGHPAATSMFMTTTNCTKHCIQLALRHKHRLHLHKKQSWFS